MSHYYVSCNQLDRIYYRYEVLSGLAKRAAIMWFVSFNYPYLIVTERISLEYGGKMLQIHHWEYGNSLILTFGA